MSVVHPSRISNGSLAMGWGGMRLMRRGIIAHGNNGHLIDPDAAAWHHSLQVADRMLLQTGGPNWWTALIGRAKLQRSFKQQRSGKRLVSTVGGGPPRLRSHGCLPGCLRATAPGESGVLLNAHALPCIGAHACASARLLSP